jgi:hypothetical protein
MGMSNSGDSGKGDLVSRTEAPTIQPAGNAQVPPPKELEGILSMVRNDKVLERIPVEKIKNFLVTIPALGEAWLHARLLTTPVSVGERLFLKLLLRKWAVVKAAADGMVTALEQQPHSPRALVLVSCLRMSPFRSELENLGGLLGLLVFGGLERGMNAAAPEIKIFAGDLRALRDAADRVEKHWLRTDHGLGDIGDKFLATFMTEFVNIATLCGIPNRPPLDLDPGPGIVAKIVEELRRGFGSSLRTVSVVCTLALASMEKLIPDLVNPPGHRPSTARRDQRLLLLQKAGAKVREIAQYESAASGVEINDAAVRAALVRARRPGTKQTPENPSPEVKRSKGSTQ